MGQLLMAMIELPRNETDVKIDGLSQAALNWLYEHGDLESVTVELTRLDGMSAAEERPEIHEIIRAGFYRYHRGGAKYVMIERNWTGHEAIERLKCGIYHRQKEMYAKRAARDEALEANPLFGTF